MILYWYAAAYFIFIILDLAFVARKKSLNQFLGTATAVVCIIPLLLHAWGII